MSLFQIITLVIALLAAGLLLWGVWRDVTRRERREQTREIRNAQMVEMMRSVSQMADATVRYLEAQGAGQRKHFEESIENFFQLHKGQSDILKKIDAQHELTRGELGYGRRKSD